MTHRLPVARLPKQIRIPLVWFDMVHHCGHSTAHHTIWIVFKESLPRFPPFRVIPTLCRCRASLVIHTFSVSFSVSILDGMLVAVPQMSQPGTSRFITRSHRSVRHQTTSTPIIKSRPHRTALSRSYLSFYKSFSIYWRDDTKIGLRSLYPYLTFLFESDNIKLSNAI
jgi:hypothetical protein